MADVLKTSKSTKLLGKVKTVFRVTEGPRGPAGPATRRGAARGSCTAKTQACVGVMSKPWLELSSVEGNMPIFSYALLLKTCRYRQGRRGAEVRLEAQRGSTGPLSWHLQGRPARAGWGPAAAVPAAVSPPQCGLRVGSPGGWWRAGSVSVLCAERERRRVEGFRPGSLGSQARRRGCGWGRSLTLPTDGSCVAEGREEREHSGGHHRGHEDHPSDRVRLLPVQSRRHPGKAGGSPAGVSASL